MILLEMFKDGQAYNFVSAYALKLCAEVFEVSEDGTLL